MNQLLKQAIKAKKNAYAPYSKFFVGAALQTKKGEVFTGCNVENSSYGGTICAERSAITSMVTAGHKSFDSIVIVTDSKVPTPPCGLCLQVLREFVSNPDKTRVHLASPAVKGGKKEYKIAQSYLFSDLLPHSFGKEFLESK